MTDPTHHLVVGNAPLLISIPHLGRRLPARIANGFAAVAHEVSDTDWHLDRLYAFATSLGATLLGAETSRYAIDFNRPPGGESLYPGQTTTGLCPTETFKGEALYPRGDEPTAEEIARRLEDYWRPYHTALQSELIRLRGLHRHVLLWEAHSICSLLPRLFDGKLPDLNFGTNDGKTCDPALLRAVLTALEPNDAGFTSVVNGRFKGGYITRNYGRPEEGTHAIQLEMCQSTYMDEQPPFGYRPDRAAEVQPVLEKLISKALDWLEEKNALAAASR